MVVASSRAARQQGLVRHDLDHQSPVTRRPGVDVVAGEAHAPGPVDPDELGQADRHAAPRHDADPGVGVGEAGSLRRDEEVAAQCQLQAAGHRRPVDGADDGRGVGRHHPDAPGGFPQALLLHRSELGGERLEVHAGAERRVRAGEHHAPHVVPAVEAGDGVVELAVQLGRDRVARLGAVEGDRGHPVRRPRPAPASASPPHVRSPHDRPSATEGTNPSVRRHPRRSHSS